MEYWKGDITQWDIETLRMKDTGHGIVLKNKVYMRAACPPCVYVSLSLSVSVCPLPV